MATKERLIIESMFRIPNKAGEDVDFLLNDVQASLDAYLTGRDIIPKMRQPGVSSYFLARFTAACLLRRNVRAVVISHESEATKRMLKRVHYFINNIRGPKPVIKNMSANEITFPKTNSMFYIGTAGAKKFGRGDTITHLHCSEVAFWEEAKTLMTGLLQAVPRSGEIALESTGNGKGNYYHRRVMAAANGKSRYRLHFFGWLFNDEYRYDLSPKEEQEILASLDPDLEEEELIKVEGIDAGRLAWRREKLEELEYDLAAFKQEYPITLDECFQASGQGIFSKVNYIPTREWVSEDRNFHVLDGHPVSGRRYAIGADVGGGVRQDNSVAEIIDVDALEQVGEWVSDKTPPDLFGSEVLPALGRQFNEAYIAVESNNHGILTLKELHDHYPSWLIHTQPKKPSSQGVEEVNKLSRLGVRTSERSKPLLIGTLRSLLGKKPPKGLIIHSPLLKDELDTFVENEGKLEAQEGCYDDRVIAAAVATFVLIKAGLYLDSPSTKHDYDPSKDPFTLDGIIAEREKARNQFPISDQAIIVPGFENSAVDLAALGHFFP